MFTKLLSQSDNTTTLLFHATTGLTTARRRWRFACVAIYSYRAFLSIINSHIAKLDHHHQSPYNTINEIEHSDPDQATHHPDQTKLAEMVRERSLGLLLELGGVKGIATALKTDVETGILVDGDGNDNINERKERYGSNTHTRPPSKGFLHFFWSAFNDPTLIILLVCAALALGFGIKEHGVKEGWYEGGSIFLAVFLVVFVSAISNYRQERQFDKLSKISDDIRIDVVRGGRRQHVSIFEVVVGDVVHLKIGDQVPADGVFVGGYSMELDESSMTGESDQVVVDSLNNPFLHSGSKVVEGHCHMLVTSVGMNTSWGQMMSSIGRDTNEQTPLQVRLNGLTSTIGKVGLTVAFLVLGVLLARYFTGNTKDEEGNKEYRGGKTSTDAMINSIVRIVAAAVTIVVVAIPEGLPLAVTLTLAYSMKRMMADQAMVRKLSACETMGSATVICTDKTGTLTLNQMKVTKYYLLGEEESSRSPFRESSRDDLRVINFLRQGIGLNTTGSVYTPPGSSGAVPEITGSPTEKAILSWAVQDLGMDFSELKQSCTVLHAESFNSEKKRSGVLVKENALDTIHMHWKGAAEIVLSLCCSYYGVKGEVKPMDEVARRKFESIIESMAARSLRCIAFAHKHVRNHADDVKLEEEDFTLLAIAGIKDPCRPEVKKAVGVCRDAGVDIKMITGDNVFTARAIATECGILEFDQQEQTTSSQVVEGVEFRNYTHEERMRKVDGIRVMARSSPMDKLLMVQCLKQKGHVVAVTGDGTNDAPALKEADIGLSMGIQGTEVAKESSDIVILDDNFNTVVTVLKWGRCVYINIQKFIQFQLTVNVAALVINFIAAVSAGDVPLTAVQMLWVNLIMDTLGALALATERPTNDLLHRPPVGRKDRLITVVMWRNLLSQAVFQITILLVLQFKGQSIFDVTKEVKDTLIFNTFVLCQVFNEFNARRLESFNIFEGIHKNPLFVGIVAVTIVLQIMMVEFLKKFAKTERLTALQWSVCLVIAAFTWPIGSLVKLIPVRRGGFSWRK